MRVYVGTYTGPKSKGIYLLDFDPVTGALTPKGVAAETPSPSFLAISPDQKFLYAANEVGKFDGKPTGSVSAFAIDPKTGDLTPLNQKPSGGADPCYVIGRPDRQVSSWWPTTAAGASKSCRSDADGQARRADRARPAQGVERRQGPPDRPARPLDRPRRLGQARRRGRPRARQADGLSVRPRGRDAHAQRHALTRASPPARALATSRSTPTASTPTPSTRWPRPSPPSTTTPPQGTLAEVQTISTRAPGGKPGNSTAEILVHPSGKFVYGSNRGDDSLAIYAVEPASGKLKLVGHQATGGKTPRNFGIDPTGRFLIAANQDSGTLVVFRVDPETGLLKQVGEPVAVPSPVCVKFVPIGGVIRCHGCRNAGQWIIHRELRLSRVHRAPT